MDKLKITEEDLLCIPVKMATSSIKALQLLAYPIDGADDLLPGKKCGDIPPQVVDMGVHGTVITLVVIPLNAAYQLSTGKDPPGMYVRQDP
jgi:hypothetical protein